MTGMGVGISNSVRAIRDGLGGAIDFEDPSLPTLLWYLRSDQGITLVGSDVSDWANQASAGRHVGNSFQQSTAAKRPFYNTAFTPQRLDFDELTDEMLEFFGDAGTDTHPLTVIALAQSDNASRIWGPQDATEQGAEFTRNGVAGYHMFDGANQTPNTGTTDTNPHIWIGEYDSAGSPRKLKLWVDGGAPVIDFTGASAPNVVDDFRLGSNVSGATTMNGWYQLFLMYDGLLTTAQKAGVAAKIVSEFPLAPSQATYSD